MHTILMVLHILVAFALIGIILIQHGRGADTGAAFGSGASSTVFGARGSATFLSRATAVLAIVFFSNSLFLAYLSSQRVTEKSLMSETEQTTAPPAADAAPSADTAAADAPPALDAAVPADAPDATGATELQVEAAPDTGPPVDAPPTN